MNYLSRNNQTIYDIALQTYGDLNMIYKLITDSNFNNVLTYPLPNTTFNFDKALIIDNVVANYLSQNGLVIVTADRNIKDPAEGASFDDSFDDSFDEGR